MSPECIFVEQVCTQCGVVSPRGNLVHRNCLAYEPPLSIGAKGVLVRGVPRGVKENSLGDHVSLILDAAGITPARVTWFLRAAKLIEADAGCGCDERKARLNRMGWRLLAWAKRKGLA